MNLRGGGLLRHKRRPSSRDGGFLRRDRRPDREADAGREEVEGDDEGAPRVHIRRRSRERSAPVARVATLAALLLLVLAVIFLL